MFKSSQLPRFGYYKLLQHSALKPYYLKLEHLQNCCFANWARRHSLRFPYEPAPMDGDYDLVGHFGLVIGECSAVVV